MAIHNPLLALLPDAKKTITLDGALATHLESLGADLTDPLWSCKTLIEEPDLIRRVHLSYYLAGADVAITASYQATARGLAEQKGFSLAESQSLIAQSVRLAALARDEALASAGASERKLFIAGSVGPYGAYLADGSEYRGDYSPMPSKVEMKDFHRPRITALVDSGVDLIALETMPNLEEVVALAELLRDEFASTAAWLSFSLKDGQTISDGTPLEVAAKAVEACEQITALGVNCVARELVTPALKKLRTSSCKLLLCYPNSGETYDARTNSWSGERKGDKDTLDGWENFVHDWKRHGARLIGGCCRTGPDDIRSIRAAIESA